MSDVISAFRHMPQKSALAPQKVPAAIRWRKEPAVTGYRQLTYHNRTLDRAIPVPISASPAVIRDIGVVVASDDGHVRLFGTGLDKFYWERRMPASIYASLVVDPASERVIVAATSGDVAAFDLRGRLVWSRALGTPVFATPALHSGLRRVVIATFEHKAFGLDLDDGELTFARDLPQPWHTSRGGKAAYRNPYASPAFTGRGTSLVCSADSVLCLDPSGRTLWQTELSAEIKASPVVADHLGVVAVATVAGQCHLLDLADGVQRGAVRLDAKVTSSGACSGDVLALGTSSGAVFGIDLRTARMLWRDGFGAPRSYTSFTLSPAGDFIATAESGNAICRDRETGAFLWESTQVMGLPDHETPMDITPVLGAAGRMYGAAYTGDLYEFSFDQDRRTAG